MDKKKIVAVVGLGAILPDALDVPSFWNNIISNKYSITEVPSDRWNVDLYYDPDPAAVDKTYSKIGAFVKGYRFDSLKNGIAIPPKVLEVMDITQQWAISASRQALTDYGYPERKLNPERVAVIFGNADGGERHYRSTMRILLPETLEFLRSVPDFAQLPEDIRSAIEKGMAKNIHSSIPVTSEDTLPGEISNIIAGRVANVFNFNGQNFVTDAACASSMAALQAAAEGLIAHKFDAVLTGGIDRNMGPESYVKFSKIGALSADGSRPYAEGANGFVMGEGAAVFLLKRLEDAERDGDQIYAVVCGIGSSSDGKGKGITAPNPVGQKLAIERAWQDAGIFPESAGLVEGHGTSTKVGDVAEVNSLNAIFGSSGLKNGSVVLGSVKSNIGHLKSASGAVGLLKTILSLHHRVLPPSANFSKPNPSIDFNNLPFRVNKQAEEWTVKEGNHRYAGVSAFGFGGTNFHIVLEEYYQGIGGTSSSTYAIPIDIHSLTGNSIAAFDRSNSEIKQEAMKVPTESQEIDIDEIKRYVLRTVSEKTGYPVEMLDPELDLEADLGIDTVKQAELFATIRNNYGIPRREDLILANYNTLSKLIDFIRESLTSVSAQSTPSVMEQKEEVETKTLLENISSETTELKPYQGLFFASADSTAELVAALRQKLTDLQAGMPHESHIPSEAERSRAERIAIDYADIKELPAKLEKVLTALDTHTAGAWKSAQAYGIYHGSGKPGKVAFLFPGQGSQYVNMLRDLWDSEPIIRETFLEADRIMTPILGRPLTAYIYTEGGEQEIKQAENELKNTAITQPAVLTANVAILRILQKYGIEPDLVMGHSLGEYAALVTAGVLTFAEALEVVCARGQEMSKIKVDDPGCMAAVSAPIEKVEEVIQSIDDYIVIANINSPVQCVLGGTTKAIDTAMSKFQAEGYQIVKLAVSHAFHTKIVAPASAPLREVIARMNVKPPLLPIVANVTGELYPTDREAILDMLAKHVSSPVQFIKGMQTLYENGARIFIEVGPKRVLTGIANDNLKGKEDVTILATNHPRKGGKASFNEALCGIYAAGIISSKPQHRETVVESVKNEVPTDLVQGEVFSFPQDNQPVFGSVVISGVGLGLPGRNHHIFDDENVRSILNGEIRIDPLTEEKRQHLLEKRVTRLIKSESGAVMENITDLDQTVKLAGQGGDFDAVEEFGFPQERAESLDTASKLAMAAGIEALRDAGIPLVLHYKQTTKGTFLPDRWQLPESMRDETGVIFCSAFPGYNRMAEETDRFYQNQILEKQLEQLRSIANLANSLNSNAENPLQNEIQKKITDLEERIKENDYHFDRRFVFRVLSMGHSQFAELIGARGPNTQINAACATTTQAVAIAEDWIRTGRCRRVVIISGDDVTTPLLFPWIGTGLFATGAATTEGNLRLAAIPFDKRRNGMIIGMGAAALVVESQDAAQERGVRAIGEILATCIANSAYHGTRLDMQHISEVMDRLLSTAENRFGIRREKIASQMMFMSHETYTPARGGSASSEIHALRSCFGDQANRIIIANTKGFTGHAMGAGIEDAVAMKALETGKIPPIANIQEGFEPDPDLGDLNLSRGGEYNPQYALRLGAGFGSQVAMSLIHKIPGVGSRIDQEKYNRWLSDISGYEQAELEVVKRTLRIKSEGVPTRKPACSTWKYGDVPVIRAVFDATEPVNASAQEPASITVPPTDLVVSQPERSQPVENQPVVLPNESTILNESEIKAYVLSIVSEKTGYPVEMLDPDLDLEADLGIDTVKQAELFAAVRSHYEIPRKEDLNLSEYNTLAKVIDFVKENLTAKESTVAESEQPVREETKQADIRKEEFVPSVQAAGVNRNDIKQFVLATVSEKTGYPAEMLDLDLDLEADLGIDTVKQAELFATIRTNYGIPRQEDLNLSNYNTLSKVIDFVQNSIDMPALSVQSETAEKVPTALGKTPDEIRTVSSESEKSEASAPKSSLVPRVPVPVLFPRIDLCLPTEVRMQGSKIIIVGDHGKVAEALIEKLEAAGAQTRLTTLSKVREDLSTWGKGEKPDGLYFLPSLDPDPVWEVNRVKDWENALTKTEEALYSIGTLLPDSAFLIGATRMGSFNGLMNCENPLNGIVTGFMKSLRRERPHQLVKVVDFNDQASPDYVADALISETLQDPVTVEIGRENDLRNGIALQEQECETVDTGTGTLQAGSTFVVSGGTGGVTGVVIQDLAKATHGSFFLLGRTELPAENDADLLKLKQDRKGFGLELQERMRQAGEKVTPVQIERQLLALERAAKTLDVMKTVEAAGGHARYILCDATDENSVIHAIETIREATDKVDVFIHAAGLDKSRKIESKTLEEFQQVIDVKAKGFKYIFNALENNHLLPDKVVFFSSVAGRFGNSGQTDYGAANDLLAKYAQWLPKRYPGMQAVAIDWSAWAEVGMASRGNMPRLMEMAGIDLLKPEEAAPMVRNELNLGHSGEVIIAGSLGILESSLNEKNCGMDIEKADVALRAGTPIHRMFSHLTAFDSNSGIQLEGELDPAQLSYLRDHAINGIPVLPGVVGIEGFAIASKHIASVLASTCKGFEIEKLEKIRFQAPLKFYGNKTRKIAWHAAAYRKPEGIVIKASLESDINRRDGTISHLHHFDSLVYLTQNPMEAESVTAAPRWGKRRSISSEEIYKLYFHGPSFQVLDAAQLSENAVLGKFNRQLMNVPADEVVPYMKSLLIELCFQSAGLWEVGSTGILSLPQSVGNLSFHKQSINKGPIFAEVQPREHEGQISFDAKVVDAKGNVILELEDYRTSPLPYSADKKLVEPIKSMVTEQSKDAHH
ncbi:MAG TPA: SDR family NAD(P)-dependent oxidoreductase [Flexilinea sp.]|nr:SDR family NAD(P)-dependent oxidoreductase [Flexilinea sp.]